MKKCLIFIIVAVTVSISTYLFYFKQYTGGGATPTKKMSYAEKIPVINDHVGPSIKENSKLLDISSELKNAAIFKSRENKKVTAEELEYFHNLLEDDIIDNKLKNQVDDTPGIFPTTKALNRNPFTNIVTEQATVATKNEMEIKYQGILKKRYPHVIIGGVKKSGTRALLSFLAKHPYVKSAGREIHFFDKEYENGIQWYLNQMPLSYENEITIEKTPGYFVKPFVPERVYNFAKKYRDDLKLIFIFRNPIERAISDYAQSLDKDREYFEFEKSVYIKDVKPKIINKDNGKIMIGMYPQHLRRWLHFFPMKQMHFVNGDEFIENPAPIIIEIQKFLNLPVLLDHNSFVYNKTKGFYCISVLKSDGKKHSDCLGPTKGRKHPPIKNKTLKRLDEFYKPYNKEFFSLINRTFDGWGV